jgi:hypothetical protein
MRVLSYGLDGSIINKCFTGQDVLKVAGVAHFVGFARIVALGKLYNQN